MGTSNNSSRIWIGVILILFGAFFLFENFFFIPFHIPYYFRQWEWILILIGIVILLTSNNKTGGVVLIGIGLLFLHGFQLIWPLLLVGIGLHFIFRRNNPATRNSATNAGFSGRSNYSQDVIDDVSIFGGGTKVIQSNNFQGGKVTALFGGSEIILSDCRLAEGEHIIDVVAVFGGSTLVVPKDWNVILDLVPVFGGFSDNRRKDPNLVIDTSKTLIIKGFILFGGGELKT